MSSRDITSINAPQPSPTWEPSCSNGPTLHEARPCLRSRPSQWPVARWGSSCTTVRSRPPPERSPSTRYWWIRYSTCKGRDEICHVEPWESAILNTPHVGAQALALKLQPFLADVRVNIQLLTQSEKILFGQSTLWKAHHISQDKVKIWMYP